jgi:hypothetical protein
LSRGSGERESGRALEPFFENILTSFGANSQKLSKKKMMFKAALNPQVLLDILFSQRK